VDGLGAARFHLSTERVSGWRASARQPRTRNVRVVERASVRLIEHPGMDLQVSGLKTTRLAYANGHVLYQALSTNFAFSRVS